MREQGAGWRESVAGPGPDEAAAGDRRRFAVGTVPAAALQAAVQQRRAGAASQQDEATGSLHSVLAQLLDASGDTLQVILTLLQLFLACRC